MNCSHQAPHIQNKSPSKYAGKTSIRLSRAVMYAHRIDDVKSFLGSIVLLAKWFAELLIYTSSVISVLELCLPLCIGHIQTKPHHYTRHKTVTLFAAMDYPQGELISSIERQHWHQKWRYGMLN